MARAAKAKAKAAEQDELDEALNLEEEGEPGVPEGMALVRANLPAHYNTRREIEINEEFYTSLVAAIGWHEMNYVEMLNPTYEEATAEE